jgi:hypothetical protein
MVPDSSTLHTSHAHCTQRDTFQKPSRSLKETGNSSFRIDNLQVSTEHNTELITISQARAPFIRSPQVVFQLTD